MNVITKISCYLKHSVVILYQHIWELQTFKKQSGFFGPPCICPEVEMST